MGTVLRAGSIRGELETREAEHKTDQLSVQESADQQASIVYGGDEHMSRDDIRLAAGPDGPLQRFDGRHIFGRFENLDYGRRHN
jgi:hypothetical protein